MGQAIGQVLPLAVGIALSPVAIIAVVLMLTTARGRSNGPACTLGWAVGLSAVGTVVLVVVEPTVGADGQQAGWVSWVKLGLGVLLLVVSVLQFRGRPDAGEQGSMPGWMGAIDRFTPGKAVGMGALLAVVNPKNLLLAVGAAVTVAQTGIPGGQQAVAYVVFGLVGTLGVGSPVVAYLALGDRAARLLSALKGWLARNNAVIMAVLCLVLGMKLVGDAIGGLTG